MIKVGINGFGTIGKRVAYAVHKQDDMEIIGVTNTKPSFEARFAIESGYKLYSVFPDKKKDFEEAGIPLNGVMDDLLEEADVIVDCTPSKVGAENKEKHYAPKKVKAIFQGGEKGHIADVSFNPLCNYKEAFGKDYVRVVSCNTTGLTTTLGALDDAFDIGKIRVMLIRRSADPGVSHKGPINAIIPDPIHVPSHHGPDVNTVMPHLNIITTAVKVPTTIMHMHSIMVELKQDVTEDQVREVLQKRPRVIFISTKDGIRSTAEIMEFSRNLNRPWSDLYEIAVWEDSISIKDNELYYFQAIHQESDVLPSNVDAIRAMFELEKDPMKSVEKTNKALGIKV
jgi:glyceraldehyde-3-phosphate dehydrogenase (NAD(P))